MESTLLSVSSRSSTASKMSIMSLSKSLNSNSIPPLIAHLHRRFYATHLLRRRCILTQFRPDSSLSRSRGLVVDLRRTTRLQCASASAASFSTGGGGGFGGNIDGGGGGGGGGDGAAEGGGDIKPGVVAAGAGDGGSLSSDVIILDVGGMTCGGCAASVKRILENQPQVSSASVNLTTETAIIWPVSEAKVAPNWKKDLGEALAKHLSSCGFKSNLRDQGAIVEEIPL